MGPITGGQGAQAHGFGLPEFEGAGPAVGHVSSIVHGVSDGRGSEGVASVVEEHHAGVDLGGACEAGWRVHCIQCRIQVEVRDGRQASIRRKDAGPSASGGKQGLHAVRLSLGEDVHAGVVGIVHVVLDHVLGAAADVSKGAAVVGAIGLGGVRHKVVGSTAAVAPDVAQVEPVADLVGRRPAEVVGTGSGTVETRELVAANDAVRGGVSAGELGVSEQSSSEVADPEVHVLIRRPGIGAPCVGELDVVRCAEPVDRGGHAEDAVGRGAVRGAGGETKLDVRVGCLRPDVVLVGVHPSEVVVQNLQLFEETSIGDVFLLVGIDHVEDHRDGDHNGLHLCAIGAGLLAGLHKGGCLLLDVGVMLGVSSISAHHLDMLVMCCTGALSGRLRSLHLSGKGDAQAQGEKERGNSHGWFGSAGRQVRHFNMHRKAGKPTLLSKSS